MRIAQIASFLHKWLALIIGVQIFIWIATGLFFTVFPIEQIRSEHRVREIAPIELQATDATALGAVIDASPHPTRVTLESRPEGSMIVAEYPDRSSALFDAHTGARLSPLNADAALWVARLRINTDASVRTSTLITTESPKN